MPAVPEFFRATAADGRGFPRIERAQAEGIQAPPPASAPLARFLSVFRSNVAKAGQPGRLVVELEDKGSKWPDFIGGGGVDRWGLLASERVIEALRRHGIDGFDPIPVDFGGRLPKKLADPPRYAALRPTRELPIQVDVYQHDDGQLTHLGRYRRPDEKPEIARYKRGRCSVMHPLSRGEQAVGIFGPSFHGFACSQQVLRLALAEGWTNLRFQAFDALLGAGTAAGHAPWILATKGPIEGPWYSELQP